VAATASLPTPIQLTQLESAERKRVKSLYEALGAHPDKELRVLFEKSQRVFDEIATRHLPRWVVTFSGGKDSTLTALLAVDYLATMDSPPHLDIVYSDTLLEIPAMRRAAGSFLHYLRKFGTMEALPIRVRVVRPKVDDRFWVRMIGKGYPPPKPKFRWCTRRLKITPAASSVTNGKPTAVLTGVRYGESTQRTGRLVASCTTGGECGQDYWAQSGPTGSNITYFAPIIEWKTCKVWDFLHFVAPRAGWPTQDVYALYGDTSLRFGCWTCTLVRRDKTMEALVARDPRSPLAELNKFRNEILVESALHKNRLWRRNHWAGLRIEFRQQLLGRLKTLERSTGMQLLSREEEFEIRRLWVEYLAHKRGPKPKGSHKSALTQRVASSNGLPWPSPTRTGHADVWRAQPAVEDHRAAPIGNDPLPR
jgi:DNA sulfur modification protein DndC